MLLRKVLMAALVVAPLAMSPAAVFAQERGSARAAQGRAAAAAGAANGAAGQPTQLPPGIAKVFSGRDLPPGIARRFPAAEPEAEPQPEPQPEPEPEPQPEPEPEPEPDPTCSTSVVLVNGTFMLKDCDGNLSPLSGTM